jgi:hypothetical protein
MLLLDLLASVRWKRPSTAIILQAELPPWAVYEKRLDVSALTLSYINCPAISTSKRKIARLGCGERDLPFEASVICEDDYGSLQHAGDIQTTVDVGPDAVDVMVGEFFDKPR